MKKLALALLSVALLLGASVPAIAGESAAPKSVIHVVTVAWKEGTTPQQIQAALDGAHALTKSFPGITRVWTKTLKIQNPRGTEMSRTHVIAMEFKDEQALKDYHQSPAQQAWYKVYENIRAQSSSFDVTN